MINVIAKLLGAPPASRVDVLSRQVAELSLESVCQLVGERVESMTFSEARGYVRARAAQIVRKQSRLAISRQAGAEQAWTVATERIVPLVLRQAGVGVPKLPATSRLAA